MYGNLWMNENYASDLTAADEGNHDDDDDDDYDDDDNGGDDDEYIVSMMNNLETRTNQMNYCHTRRHRFAYSVFVSHRLKRTALSATPYYNIYIIMMMATNNIPALEWFIIIVNGMHHNTISGNNMSAII